MASFFQYKCVINKSYLKLDVINLFFDSQFITLGTIFILRKDIGVGGRSRKWQFSITLCINKNDVEPFHDRELERP